MPGAQNPNTMNNIELLKTALNNGFDLIRHHKFATHHGIGHMFERVAQIYWHKCDAHKLCVRMENERIERYVTPDELSIKLKHINEFTPSYQN